MGIKKANKKSKLLSFSIFQLLTHVSALILLIVLGLTCLTFSSYSFNATFAATSPVVTITFPSNGSTVGNSVNVLGTSQNVPSDSVVWIAVFVSAKDVNRFYPTNNPVTTQPNGNWSCLTYVGGPGDTGYIFDIIAFLAGPTAQDHIREYLAESEKADSYPGVLIADWNSYGLVECSRVSVTLNTTYTPPPSSPTPSTLHGTVEIVSPRNEAIINHNVEVNGTSQGLGSDEVVWLVVHQGNRYYPTRNNVTITSEGYWNASITVGGDNDMGKTFEIYAIIANKTIQDEINAYHQDIEQNHPGDYSGIEDQNWIIPQTYDKVEVTRATTSVSPSPTNPTGDTPIELFILAAVVILVVVIVVLVFYQRGRNNKTS